MPLQPSASTCSWGARSSKLWSSSTVATPAVLPTSSIRPAVVPLRIVNWSYFNCLFAWWARTSDRITHRKTRPRHGASSNWQSGGGGRRPHLIASPGGGVPRGPHPAPAGATPPPSGTGPTDSTTQRFVPSPIIGRIPTMLVIIDEQLTATRGLRAIFARSQMATATPTSGGT